MDKNLTIIFHFANVAEEKKWETNFCNFLKLIIKQITGIIPTFISNLDIPGNTYNSHEEYEKNLNPAALIIVFNHNYNIISDNELIKIQKLTEKLEKNKQSNVYIVQRINNNGKDLPKELQNYPVYNFFELNPRTLELIDFKQDIHDDDENRYILKLTDLAYDIKTSISSNGNENSAILRNNSVYLAEVSIDQIKNYESLKRSLMLTGYRILPKNPLIASENYEKVVKENIKNCVLSVNILGELYGDTDQNSDYSFQELQNRYFHDVWMDQQKNKSAEPVIRRIIWIPPQMEPSDDKQVQYLKRINREINNSENTELIQSTISDLKIIIDGKMKLLSQPNIISGNFSTDELLLILDYDDTECLTKISETLSQLNIKYQFLNDFTNTHLYNQLELMNYINKFSTYLVFNTKSDMGWISGTINLLARSKGYDGSVIEGHIGLFSLNPRIGFNNKTALTIEPYVYDNQNLAGKLELFISKIKI
jgi:hypothetical protein